MDSQTKYIADCLNSEERKAYAELRRLKAYQTIDAYSITDIARGEPAFTDVWTAMDLEAGNFAQFIDYGGDFQEEAYLRWFGKRGTPMTLRAYRNVCKWLDKYERMADESDHRVVAREESE